MRVCSSIIIPSVSENIKLFRIRKQSPRPSDPCQVVEDDEDVTIIIMPSISRLDILLNSETLEHSSHIV